MDWFGCCRLANVMKIEAKQVRCTEIFVEGQSIGVFYRKGDWNGLSELRRIGDEQMIVIGTPDVNGFNPIFGELFGAEEKKDTYLVDGSASLIDQIKEIEEKEKSNNK